MKFLASVAFVQSKMGQDIIDHPFGGEMAYRANLQVSVEYRFFLML
jgi:hypothetical protein